MAKGAIAGCFSVAVAAAGMASRWAARARFS